jgi:hypothetical protein
MDTELIIAYIAGYGFLSIFLLLIFVFLKLMYLFTRGK